MSLEAKQPGLVADGEGGGFQNLGCVSFAETQCQIYGFSTCFEALAMRIVLSRESKIHIPFDP